MHTKDRLARDLMEIGLEELSVRAARGEFDDFLSDHANPQGVLAAELAWIGNDGAMRIRAALLDGAYDATTEESDAWAESEAGRAVLSKLVKGE